MKLTQNQLRRGNALLNQHAVYIKGTEATFYVHYWGGELSLKTNTPHKHSFFEVCYILGGEGIYKEGEMEYTLNRGELFISRPHVKHQIISKRKLSILFVAFEPIYNECSEGGQQLFQQLSTIEPVILNIEDDCKTEWMWKSLLLLAQHPTNFANDTIVSLGCSLIFTIAQLYLRNQNCEVHQEKENMNTTLVHRAKLYIRDNLSQPLRLTDVADNLHISSRHLSRVFAEELGVTFTRYVRNERINRATILLTTTDLPIKTISNQTGFETVHYFTTVFKEIMGVTPGEFSKKLITNE